MPPSNFSVAIPTSSRPTRQSGHRISRSQCSRRAIPSGAPAVVVSERPAELRTSRSCRHLIASVPPGLYGAEHGDRAAAVDAKDAEAHAAGEDDASVRWLSGGYAPVEGVREYFGWLAANEAAGSGKRGFGIWIDGRLGGYTDFDPDNTGGSNTRS